MKHLDKTYTKNFDFECFPELKVVFVKLVECKLRRIMGGNGRESGKESGRGAEETGLDNILSKIASLESEMQTI